MAYTVSNLEPLINPLRMHLGDLSSSPTYSDETLHEVLRYAISALGKRWNYKYYVDNDGVVQRSSNFSNFRYASPPVIERSDHRAIVLQSAIIIKSGELRNNISGGVSWRDDEISYDARESLRQRSTTLNQDIEELNKLLPIKLATGTRRSLPGYTNNSEENDDWS